MNRAVSVAENVRIWSQVLSERFFTSETETSVKITQLQKSIDALRCDVRQLSSTMEISSAQLATGVASLLHEQCRSTRTILNAVVSHSQNVCPSVFGITPYMWRNEFMWKESGGHGLDADGQPKWKHVILRFLDVEGITV